MEECMRRKYLKGKGRKIFAAFVTMTTIANTVIPGTLTYAEDENGINQSQEKIQIENQKSVQETEEKVQIENQESVPEQPSEKAQIENQESASVQKKEADEYGNSYADTAAYESAANNVATVTTGKCGDNATYTLYSDGTFVVSGTGPMDSYEYDWKYYCPTCPWSGYRGYIKKIVIEDGITSVGSYAFMETGLDYNSSCIPLEEIVIGNTVEVIEKYAFDGCNTISVVPIKQVSLGSGIKKVDENAFRTIGKIQKVTIPSLDVWMNIDFENEASTPMWGGNTPRDNKAELYIDGTKLVNLTIPDGTTEIKPYTFRNCRLTSVRIPNSVTSIGEGGFSYNDFGQIDIPDSVQNIGEYALAGCTNLTKIELSDNIKTLGAYAFYNSTGVKEIRLSQNLTRLEDGLFAGCTKLESIVIPDAVTDIGEDVFNGCESVMDLRIPEGVTSIGTFAFSNCTSLERMDIPDSVVNMGQYVFSRAKQLEMVHLPAKIKEIGEGMFYDCTSLSSITIPDDVEKIGYQAFSNCTSLRDVSHSDNVTQIEKYAFSGCSQLTSFEIPGQVTAIEEGVFSGCKKLDGIELPTGIERIEKSAFSGCVSLQKIVLPDTVRILGEKTFDGCTGLNEIVLSNELTTISPYCFQNCTGIEKIILPEKISLVDNYAFYNCKALNEVVFTGDAPVIKDVSFGGVTATCYYPKDNTTYTLEITTKDFGGDLKWTYEGEEEDKDFHKCGENITWQLSEEGVLSLTGNGDMYDYPKTELRYAPWYEERNNIKTIQVNEGITHLGEYAFYDCQNAETISIAESVQSIGKYAFYFCKFSNVKLPESMEVISESMFENCRYLKYVEFPKNLKRIEKYGFGMCLGLNSVEIPEGVTSIGDGAFTACGNSSSWGLYYSCYDFTSVKLPSTLKSLGTNAFRWCTELRTINIPNGLTELRTGTFEYCYKLQTVTFEWGVPQMPQNIFDTLYSKTVLLTCYYPGNNPEWTADKLQKYGAKSINWVAKEMEKPSSGSGGDTGSGGSGSGGTGSGSGSSSGGNSGSGNESGGNSGSGGSGSGSESGTGSGSGNGSGNGSESGGNTGSGEIADLGFQAHSLTLEGDIGVNFYLELNDTIVNDASAVMEMSIAGKTISNIKVSDAVKAGTTEVKDSNGISHSCYKFTCNVNAKQMTDTIQATLKTGNQTWKEEYSVQKYADEAKNSDNKKLIEIVDAMLTYGAYAQKLFSYNTDSLAGGNLADVSSVTAEDLVTYGYQKEGEEENLSLYGASLLLKDTTTIRVYYQLKDGNIEDFEFYIDGQKAEPVKSGNNGLYYVEVKNLAAQDLDETHTFKVGNLVISNYSALSYAKSVLDYEKSSEVNKNAMAAMYLYWKAAETYFN